MEFVNYGYGHAAKRPSAPPNGTVYFAIDDGSLSFFFNGEWTKVAAKTVADKLIFNDDDKGVVKEVTTKELLDYSKPIINNSVLTFGYYYIE
jgi:hypothetical protein